MKLRSRLVNITSIYLLLAAGINLYYGFTLFFSGAVALFFSSPVAANFAGESNKFTIDASSGYMTLMGLFLLATSTLMIVTAIALYARKDGVRTRTIYIALLSIIACVLCVVNTLTIQWIPLILSLVVFLLFTFDPMLNHYLQRRSR